MYKRQVLSWVSYSDEAKQLREKLTVVQARHDALKTQVDSLSNDSLDLDALEIAVRRDLYVSGANEMTIWLDP